MAEAGQRTARATTAGWLQRWPKRQSRTGRTWRQMPGGYRTNRDGDRASDIAKPWSEQPEWLESIQRRQQSRDDGPGGYRGHDRKDTNGRMDKPRSNRRVTKIRPGPGRRTNARPEKRTTSDNDEEGNGQTDDRTGGRATVRSVSVHMGRTDTEGRI